MRKSRKPRTWKAWVEVGSHGGIFRFAAGPVAARYPNLMHVYTEPAPDRIAVTITEDKRPTRRKETRKC